MSFRILLLSAAAALVAGCSTPTTTSEYLSKARFRTMTAAKPQQQKLLDTLAAGKVTKVEHRNRTYYVFPNAKEKRIYVGNRQEYAAYQRLCARGKFTTAPLVEAPDPNGSQPWNAWSGMGDGWSTF